MDPVKPGLPGSIDPAHENTLSDRYLCPGTADTVALFILIGAQFLNTGPQWRRNAQL